MVEGGEAIFATQGPDVRVASVFQLSTFESQHSNINQDNKTNVDVTKEALDHPSL